MSECLTPNGMSGHGPPDQPDVGPQRGPVSVAQIEAQTKQVKRELDVVTYAVRGCQYPGCRKETRHYQEFNGLSYCDAHIKEVRAGKRLDEIFATVGTGEP